MAVYRKHATDGRLTMQSMNQLAHFAINADDIEVSRRFYENVFGWKFRPYGPPGFYQATAGDGGPMGALQSRREIVPGAKMLGFECTIAVRSVDETAAAIEAGGGKIVMKRVTLVGVGHLIFFQDPGGNIAGAMEYDSAAE
jgi:predicted enzyme related to lactoylglutathione lyase